MTTTRVPSRPTSQPQTADASMSGAPLLAVLRPHHFGVSVPDLESAIEWYRRILGFEPESQADIDKIPARVAFLRRGNFRIELFEVPGAAALPHDRRIPNLDLRTHGNKHLCFEVVNVAAAVAALRAATVDIAFEVVVDGAPVAFIRDVCGNLIELIEPFRSDVATDTLANSL